MLMLLGVKLLTKHHKLVECTFEVLSVVALDEARLSASGYESTKCRQECSSCKISDHFNVYRFCSQTDENSNIADRELVSQLRMAILERSTEIDSGTQERQSWCYTFFRQVAH
uniref:(northern house mosquito) hypothetical protein n=1 Tax=Culex pipiens TaxID=7175 RepID=A0A8D8D906_CULPI